MIEEIAGDEYLLRRKIDDRVPGGIASAQVPDLDKTVAEIDIELVIKRNVGNELNHVLEFSHHGA
jgi:hypothetical protein